MKYSQYKFTLVEMVIVLVLAAALMLPISVMMGAMTHDYIVSIEIRRHQEDVDLAAYALKGIIEEAMSYEIEKASENESAGDKITLQYLDGTLRTISYDPETKRLYEQREGSELSIVEPIHLSILEFERVNESCVEVRVESTYSPRSEARRVSRYFRVFLRNHE